jgi:Mor family transcriptional regulator
LEVSAIHAENRNAQSYSVHDSKSNSVLSKRNSTSHGTVYKLNVGTHTLTRAS